MAMAVRIVRAAAGRDKVVLCGYHGWHDWHDWCLAANLGGESLGGDLLPGLDPAGVTAALDEVERNWPRRWRRATLRDALEDR